MHRCVLAKQGQFQVLHHLEQVRKWPNLAGTGIGGGGEARLGLGRMAHGQSSPGRVWDQPQLEISEGAQVMVNWCPFDPAPNPPLATCSLKERLKLKSDQLKALCLCSFFLPQLQGAIMVASCFQIFVGFSGLIGFLMKFIGPLTIAPTISLVALPLFDSAGQEAGSHWGIAAV